MAVRGPAGKPLVAHGVVALRDNDNQGIVPVPRRLGNGQAPESNLYWGAAFGVRRYFTAAAYNRFQRCGIRSARRLFAAEP